ncbi:MAG: DUF4091 domain-containing protein [Actinomycetia bacterium]|nr:DUF4091 domain-containing protein [Actinomycetes bacterium]
MINTKCGLEFETYKHVHGARVKYDVPFDESKQIRLTCARNDRAAVQLLLFSEAEALVNIGNDPCFYEKGPIDTIRVKAAIPGPENNHMEIRTNLIGLVEDDDRQLKSDILLKQTVIYLEQRRVQPVWVEVKLGRDVEPGIYHPEIYIYGQRMFENEKIICTLSFELHVLDVILDSPDSYSFDLKLMQHNSNLARKYDVENWCEKHFEIMENYIISLSELGQKTITVILSEIPWSGQNSCLDRIDPANMFEYNMAKIIFSKDGHWTYDFTAVNRYVEMCMKHGIGEEIDVLGLINIWLIEEAGYGKIIPGYPDGIRVRFYDENDCTYKYIRNRKDLEAYISAVERNFIKKGWIDKVRIFADEPSDVAVFNEMLNALKKIAPSFKYKVFINHVEFIEKDIEGIYDYVPMLPCVCAKYNRLKELQHTIKGKLTFYVCCDPDYPNTFISSHLLESRLIPWLVWQLELDGFFRWNYTVWPNDPLRKIVYLYPNWKAGDTNFVYPGRDGSPMLTLRYKSLQKGIRDFEILSRYSQSNGRDEITEMLKEVFLWKDIAELHPDSRKRADELFSLNYEKYEHIIESILIKMSRKGK